MKKVKDHLVKVVKNDIQMVSNLLYGRSSYPPKVLKILDKYGNQKITALRIYRVPLSSVTMNAIDLVTWGEFTKRQAKTPYDKLFHLRLDVKLKNGVLVAIEKLETLSISLNTSLAPESETMEITMVPDITLIEFVKNCRKTYKQMFLYRAFGANCQDLLVNLLKANNITDSKYIDFIKQDTDELFDVYLRKLSNTVTDALEKTTTIINGGCINCDCGCSIKPKSYNKHLNSKKHLTGLKK